MSREKQIEEMAFDLCLIDTCKHLTQTECNNTTCAHCEAEALYNAGYRKQSEAQRQIPCEIGSKIYEVTGEPGEQIDIDEHTVSEVGLNGVFTNGRVLRYQYYFAYADEGAWWFFKREDAEAEKKRRDEV